MNNVISDILSRIDSDNRNLPPTHLYNEGWLLCIILHWFSNNKDTSNHELEFFKNSKWYSEALLPSPFLPEFRGDTLSEAHTHADGVIGKFKIGSSGHGDLVLEDDCDQFIVIEAKMYSKLSKGIKNNTTYDQVTRNIACMSQIAANQRIDEKQFKKLAFYVIAPEEQIKKERSFREYTTKEIIKEKVFERVNNYYLNERESFNSKLNWFNMYFISFIETIEIKCITWEEVIKYIHLHDPNFSHILNNFYNKCIHYNKKSK
ncbi:hypothetical protein RGU12_01955 [Fredinandcohnia sp. QZ13]|uniref:hypothetical protein n=1 Tax=Fredinandcohnia sp. QZ13 TaxID=3073144 RepID=UPI0028535334|nr:hypothetical protein [Fredinandcohnia sp. QZ13]MDR4886307.1 hypothetical protein [Fredinandcohnia sp. QZ13]